MVAGERTGTHLVAAGTPAEVTVDAGDFVRVAGGAGLVAVVVGYAWLVVAAGIV